MDCSFCSDILNINTLSWDMKAFYPETFFIDILIVIPSYIPVVLIVIPSYIPVVLIVIPSYIPVVLIVIPSYIPVVLIVIPSYISQFETIHATHV
jgi:hypothetical protein